MATALLLLSFFAFHGTSGNHAKNTFNMFLIATHDGSPSPKHLGYCCRSDNFDYFLYKLDGLVYHLNHYSPLLELDDFILTTVREARMALLPSQEQSPQCRFLFLF